jgi:hypothetical protein
VRANAIKTPNPHQWLAYICDFSIVVGLALDYGTKRTHVLRVCVCFRVCACVLACGVAVRVCAHMHALFTRT